jgi:hypothetical protein
VIRKPPALSFWWSGLGTRFLLQDESAYRKGAGTRTSRTPQHAGAWKETEFLHTSWKLSEWVMDFLLENDIYASAESL